MSSRTYYCELVPEPSLRRLVLGAGCCSMLLGVFVILGLPVDKYIRAAAVSLWCLIGGAELRLISIAHGHFSRVRILCDGVPELLDRDGVWQAAEMTSGCVVLPRLAWLRLKLANGHSYCELMRGDSRESKQWRRLQVIWRHLGAAGRSC
ncbi:MAG: hypothetical protein ACR2QT_14090 [Woeseiaceae bacterium]